LPSWKDHITIQQQGGLYDPASSSEFEQINTGIVRDLFDDLLLRMVADKYIERQDQVELLFINNHRIGAFVIGDLDRYAICVSIGATRAIWNLLVLSLADPDILPGYPGDTDIRYAWPSRIADQTLLGPAVESSFDYDGKYPRPSGIPEQHISRERLELCTLCYHWIVDYLLYHEAAHIIRDHLSFFSVYYNEQVVDETQLFEGKALHLMQLFELDADVHALDYVIQSNEELDQLDQLSISDFRGFFFIELFGYIMIQQLFDYEHNRIADQLQLDHPPPVFRAIIWTNSLVKTFREVFGKDDTILKDEHNKAWYEASKIAAKLGFPEGRWRGDHMNDVPLSAVDDLVAQYENLATIIDITDPAESLQLFRSYLGENDLMH